MYNGSSESMRRPADAAPDSVAADARGAGSAPALARDKAGPLGESAARDKVLLAQAARLWHIVGVSTSLTAGLRELLDSAVILSGAGAASFMVVLPESRELAVRATQGMRTPAPAARQVPWGTASSDPLGAMRGPLWIRTLLPPTAHTIPVAADEDFQAYLGLPVRMGAATSGTGHEAVGLLNLYWRRSVAAPDTDTLGVLESVTRALAVLLEQTALRESNALAARVVEQVEAHKAQTQSLLGHQMRTPITSIGGFAQLMIRKTPDPASPVHRYAGTILSEVQRLSLLIDNVLELGRLERSLLATEVRPFDLAALLAEVGADPLLKGELTRESLVWDLQQPLSAVIGDPLRLKQALLALLRRWTEAPAPDCAPAQVRLTVRQARRAAAPVVELVVAGGVSGPVGASVDDLLAALDLREALGSLGVRQEELALYSALQLLRAMGAAVGTEQDAQGRTTYVLSLPVLEDC